MSDNNEVFNELNKAFEEFKSANDARLAEIESKGKADPLTDAKVERINSAISELEAKMTAVEKKAGRLPAGETADAAAEEYRAAFGEWARKGRNEAELESKAVNVTTGADGGHALPAIVDSNIIQTMVDLSPVRSRATIISVSSSSHSVLRNDKGLASGWVDENDARTETASMALSKIAINMGEVYANPAATQQALDDLSFDVEAFLAAEIAEAFAVAEGAAFVNGNGTNKPLGLLQSSLTTINSGHATTIDNASCLLDLIHGVKAGHRQGASFLMNTATLAVLRKLKDSNGQYIWQPSVQAGAPSAIFGYEVLEDENMPALGAGADSVLFGNLKKYVIADRVGIRTVRDPYSNKPYVMFYTTKRVGGRVVDPAAFRVLNIAA